MHCRDHVVRVHQQEQRFQARDTRVWVIGFAPARRVRGWLERAEVSFPFLLDPAQEVYERYEIERSMLRSWSPRNLWSYVKAFFRGRELHGIREDPNRLGADFIVDRQRRLRFVYYSQDPTDRPAVETLLEKLKEIEE